MTSSSKPAAVGLNLNQDSYALSNYSPKYMCSLSLFLSLRNGGGIGDSQIRKMSYFEGSKDPRYKVRKRYCFFSRHCK